MKWIPVFLNLPAHYKTERAALALGIERATMVGYLINLWIWAAEYAADGSLKGFSEEDIARASGVPSDAPFTADRFVEVLVGCGRGNGAGFLEFDPQGGLTLHDWMQPDHSGGHALKLKRESRRVMESRAKKRNDGEITGKLRVTYDGDSSSLISTAMQEEREGVRGRDENSYADVTRNRMGNEELRKTWARALQSLAGEMTPGNFETWFAGTVLLECDRAAVIGVPSPFQLETLKIRLGPTVSRVLSAVVGRYVECRFVPIPGGDRG